MGPSALHQSVPHEVQTHDLNQGPPCPLEETDLPELGQVPGTRGQGDGPDALWASPGHSGQFLSSSQTRQRLLPSGCSGHDTELIGIEHSP